MLTRPLDLDDREEVGGLASCLVSSSSIIDSGTASVLRAGAIEPATGGSSI